MSLPLIAHSILFARSCPEIERLIVSTEDPEIAAVARSFGAETPFLRPSELAGDEIPLWKVVRHALEEVERQESARYEQVALLDPTSPAREPSDVQRSVSLLKNHPLADGVVGVSQPDFNPIWHCVVEEDGWMVNLMKEADRFERRQEVKPVYRINGSLYLWRAPFVRRETRSWRLTGRHLIHEIPELRAMSIDTLEEFERAEALVKSGLIHFPWLVGSAGVQCVR